MCRNLLFLFYTSLIRSDMKRTYLAICATVLLCLVISSCKEVVLPEAGKRVPKVTYSADTIEASGTDTYDYQTKYHAKAIVVPPSTFETTFVSREKPVRRGYVFQYWTDGVNKYQPGDRFTENTVTASDGSVHLKAVFTTENGQPALDSKYWTDSKERLFTVTVEEMHKIPMLRAHTSGVGNTITTEKPNIDQDFCFVNFPGGYIWDYLNFRPSLASNDPITYPKYWHKATIGLNEGILGKTYKVIEDFALADTEVTGALTQVVLKWNEDNNKGYDFYHNFLQEASGSSRYMTSGTKITIAGELDAYYNRYSAEDPLVNISPSVAIVLCNAITQWYNETRNPKEKLTFAYTTDGRPYNGTNLIKDVDDWAISRIGTRQHPYYAGDEPLFAHVQGSTGFRLPTHLEWFFAATVNPENDTTYPGYTNASKTVMYPSMINPNYVVGGTFTGSSNLDSGTVKYAVTRENHGEDASDPGTQRVKSKIPSIMGLYDMSGNVSEICLGAFADKHVDSDSKEERLYHYTAGGSYYHTGLYTRPAYINKIDRYDVSNASGFRLCRTTATYPVIY